MIMGKVRNGPGKGRGKASVRGGWPGLRRDLQGPCHTSELALSQQDGLVVTHTPAAAPAQLPLLRNLLDKWKLFVSTSQEPPARVMNYKNSKNI